MYYHMKLFAFPELCSSSFLSFSPLLQMLAIYTHWSCCHISRAAPAAWYHLTVPRARTLAALLHAMHGKVWKYTNIQWFISGKFNHVLESQGSTKHLQNSINVYFLCDLSDFYFYNIEKCILWIGLVNINLVFLLSDVNRTTKWTLVPFPIIFTQLHELDCQSCPAVWCKWLRKYKTQSVHIILVKREEKNPSLILKKACSKQNWKTKSFLIAPSKSLEAKYSQAMPSYIITTVI